MKLIVFGVIEGLHDLDEMTGWVRSLGLDPKDVRPFGALINRGDGWTLHMRRFRRNDNGRSYLVDGPPSDVACEPVAVDVSAAWPSWLNLLGPVDVPDAPGETVVESLRLATCAHNVSRERRRLGDARQLHEGSSA